MRLVLQNLVLMHAKLRGYPTDLHRFGALALQKAGHATPVQADIGHSGRASSAEVEWLVQELALLEVLDGKRVTEDGAESVALAYANNQEGWIVKRRLQQGEKADWLLCNEERWLALEVSGMAEGDPVPRLEEKKHQIAQCSLPVERLAIVVAFDRPAILADSP